MNKSTKPTKTVTPVGKWGRYWLYQARFKVKLYPDFKCPVMIKWKRTIAVEDYVQYATLDSAFGKSLTGVPAWKIGRVSSIARNVLHLEKCEK